MSGHPKSPGYKPGRHRVICDLSGLEFYSDEMRLRWDGLLVHKSHWEPRHPQDFLRARKDRIKPLGPVRPEQEDRFMQGNRTGDDLPGPKQ